MNLVECNHIEFAIATVGPIMSKISMLMLNLSGTTVYDAAVRDCFYEATVEFLYVIRDNRSTRPNRLYLTGTKFICH